MATTNLPMRPADDEIMPDEDTSEVTKLFLERLSAWKHAVAYLEDYVTATEKVESSSTKDYEKILKTINQPLKEPHHFDQNLGGITGMFENMKSNTQGLATSHTETAKALKSTVLPIFDRLSSEIKSKNKEITKGAGKGSKAVDKARSTTQKHIEKLGQQTATFGSAMGKSSSANDDPYVLKRQIYHRLNLQLTEENNNRQELLGVQSSFAQFEAHIVQSIQNGMLAFDQIMGRQADMSRQVYGDMSANVKAIPADFEWRGFLQRNNQMLINPSDPPRTVDNMGFANENHKSTQPIIAGSLDRRSKILKKYEPGFYAISASKYLHEFKTNDNFAKDPLPENSLYLPDCIVGALDGVKFAVKGKDASKGSIGSKLSMSHEYQFQARSPHEASQWYEAICAVAGTKSDEMPESDDSRNPSRQGSNNLDPQAGLGQAPPQHQQSFAAPAGAVPHQQPGVGSAVTTGGAQAVPSGATGVDHTANRI